MSPAKTLALLHEGSLSGPGDVEGSGPLAFTYSRPKFALLFEFFQDPLLPALKDDLDVVLFSFWTIALATLRPRCVAVDAHVVRGSHVVAVHFSTCLCMPRTTLSRLLRVELSVTLRKDILPSSL